MFRPYFGNCKCHNQKRLIVVKAGLCKQGNDEKKGKKPTKIKMFSNKRIEQNKAYSDVSKKYLKEHPVCEVALEICTINAIEIHHKVGRIGFRLTDKKKFVAVCRACHRYLEEHPNWAKENNYSVSRLAK